MLLTSNWRIEIQERWGTQLLGHLDRPIRDVLWITRCSKTKNGVCCGMPKELYVSAVNKHFYRFVEERGVRYGVLSDKYGLHLDDERLPYYDVHPSQLTKQDRQRLGRLVRHKVLGQGFDQVVFYSPSPLMSIPYFEILHYSGLRTFYTTNLTFSERCEALSCHL